METFKLIFALLFCCCLTACQWNLEEIDLANEQITCLQNCINGIFNKSLCSCDCYQGWMEPECTQPQTGSVINFKDTISARSDSLRAFKILSTSDKGYLISSITLGVGENSNIRLYKLNYQKDIIWSIDIVSFSGVPVSLMEVSDLYYLLTSSCRLFSINSTSGNVFDRGSFTSNCKGLTKAISPNNSVVIAGSRLNSVPLPDFSKTLFWIAKIDASGNITWNRSTGNTFFNQIVDIKIDNENYSTLGYSDSNDTDFQAYYGCYDYIFLKFNSEGQRISLQNYGGTGCDRAQSFIKTSDNHYLLAGYCTSNDADLTINYGNNDFCVIKIDEDGKRIWGNSYGGSNDDYLFSVQEINDSNYILGGYTSSTDFHITNNNGQNDFWLVKIDTFGNIIWEKTYGTSGDEILSDMQVTSDGGFIMVGTKDSKDIYIVKTDANGNL